MTNANTCQYCSRLPPPPPFFSIGPPPAILSIDFRCSSRLLSSSPSSSFIQHKRVIPPQSSLLSAILGIVIVLLISTGTIALIKYLIIKRKQRRQRKYHNSFLLANFNERHDDRNWKTLLPLLSDSCSSDQTLSTPPSEYPCGIIEPLLTNGIHHEYEQINYDNSSHYYSLIYCRQCAGYHQTLLRQPTSLLYHQMNRMPTYRQHHCTCDFRNEDRLLELQPILKTDSDNLCH